MLLIVAARRLPAAKATQGQKLDAQPCRHDFQEAAGARGATVVHHEISHPAVGLQSQDLAVLAADVDHRVRVRHAPPHSPSLTRHLRHGGIGKVDQPPPISCGDNRAHVRALQPLPAQQLVQQLGGQRILVDALVPHAGRHNTVSVGLDQHDFQGS